MVVLAYVLAVFICSFVDGKVNKDTVSMVGEGVHEDKKELRYLSPYMNEKYFRMHASRPSVLRFSVLPASRGLK